MYKGDVDFERLMPLLSMLPEHVKVVNRDSLIVVKEVTAISTICVLMNTTSIGKAIFSEIHKLLCLYLNVPMTSASSERTFSNLRRLNNYLCSNMSQECLNHAIILHTHKDCTNKINLEEIAEEFVTCNTLGILLISYYQHVQVLLIITFITALN